MDGEELRIMEQKVAESSSATHDSLKGSTSASSDGVDELKTSIQDITMQLNNVHLTEAKKYSIRTNLKMKKAALIRRRRIRMK